MPGLWTRWESSHFFTRLRTTNTASLQEGQSKNSLVQFPDDSPITRREFKTNTRAVIKNFRKQPRTFGGRARQRHTKTSRIHAFRRNAAGRTQRGGLVSFPTASTAALVSSATSCTMRSWSLNFASSSGNVAACTSVVERARFPRTPWFVKQRAVEETAPRSPRVYVNLTNSPWQGRCRHQHSSGTCLACFTAAKPPKI